jgi:hypothetical protein
MASLFRIELDEIWKFLSALNQGGWTGKIVGLFVKPSNEAEESLSHGIGSRLQRVAEGKSFITPTDVMSQYGCFICGSRHNVRELKLGYSYQLTDVSKLFTRCGNHYHMLTCQECRGTLIHEVIAPWLEKKFIREIDHRWGPGQYAPCPICGEDDQDGRTLCVFPWSVDGVIRVVQQKGDGEEIEVCIVTESCWYLERGFYQREGETSPNELWFGTCGQCRGEFLTQVGKWCRGELLQDGQTPRQWEAVALP